MNCTVFNRYVTDSYTGHMEKCGGEIKPLELAIPLHEAEKYAPYLLERVGSCQRCGLVYFMGVYPIK